MCIGLPMQVVEARVRTALCRGRGEVREIDTSLVGDVAEGTWVLVFLDAAREILSADQAAAISGALEALSLAMAGETDVDHLFPDLAGREPELPDFLIPRLNIPTREETSS